MTTTEQKISPIKKWIISIRPFSMPASTMPVVFGTVLAAVYGGYAFKPGLFLLAFVGMVILHSGSNILSDIADYNKGLDKVPTPVSGGVVRGLISTREAFWASLILLLLGTAIGLYLVSVTGITLLYIGIVGLFIGVFYTIGGKIALKYHALGDFAVFMNFGILGSLGAWYVQTQTFSWIPVLWAIPMSMLVIGILHANNWRDIDSDTKGKIYTMASLFGDKNSLRYYAFLIFGPFAVILGLIFIPRMFTDLPAMPYTFLLTLISIPIALKLWRKALDRKTPKKPLDFITLDGATAQYNLAFGILCTVSLLLEALVKYVL